MLVLLGLLLLLRLLLGTSVGDHVCAIDVTRLLLQLLLLWLLLRLAEIRADGDVFHLGWGHYLHGLTVAAGAGLDH